MIKKILFIMFTLAPIMGFGQGKNNVSFGVGMMSEKFSDQNFSSLAFAGTGYNIGLAYERQLTPKIFARGAFEMQLSELNHELYPQPISRSYSGMDLMLFHQLLFKYGHKLSLGLGYRRVYEGRTMEYGDWTNMQEWCQGLALSPEYQFDGGNYLFRFSTLIPVLSRANTQAHAGNARHEFHFASLHNYFSLLTTSSVYFRMAPSHYLGMDYSWHFRNNEVVKPINKASHAVRISYRFHF